IGMSALLELQIASNHFLDVFADHQLAEILQVRQAAQKQHPLDQPVCVFHLVDGFFVLVCGKLAQTPIAQHPRMQKVLVDGGEFVLENQIEEADDFGVARDRSDGGGAYAAWAGFWLSLASSSISSISSWHRPQFLSTPHLA